MSYQYQICPSDQSMQGVISGLQAAFDMIDRLLLSGEITQETPVTLFLQPGLYFEKLTITKAYLTICGQSAATTCIAYHDYALMPYLQADGSVGKAGTFRTATLRIAAHDVTLRNVTVANVSGYGKQVGQALAVYADGDRLLFEDCRLSGSQDTLFTAPLPPAALQKNGFAGPGENKPRLNGRHCYRRCYIAGDIDFIFGSATAFFEDCEIYTVNRYLPFPGMFPREGYDSSLLKALTKQTGISYPVTMIHADPINTSSASDEIYGYCTAASTVEGQTYGYVFSHCKLTSECPPHSCYLGRPWRNFAKTVFLYCFLDAHIRPEGWHDWNKPEAHTTMLYAEYKNNGPGAVLLRASFARELTAAEAVQYIESQVLTAPLSSDYNA